MSRRVAQLPAAVFSIAGLALFGCGSDAPGLADFLPPAPSPTGAAQQVFAGPISSEAIGELLAGPASSGRVGDYFMRNDQIALIIQSPTRVIGVVPQGGNLVDAVLLDGGGEPASEDHFGELSFGYAAGRTCEHHSVEVIADGSGGGAAAIRAIGRADVNDYINIKSIGLLPIPDDIDPDIPDDIACATTYVLEPGASELEVTWTLFNDGSDTLKSPAFLLADTGGETGSFAPGRGFTRAGIGDLATLTAPAPVDYVVYQGPGVAYGLVPIQPDPTDDISSLTIAGASITVLTGASLLEMLNREKWSLVIEPEQAHSRRAIVAVGRDASDVERVYRDSRGESSVPVSGVVSVSAIATAAAPVRVGIYRDSDQSGGLSDDDEIATYVSVGVDGAFRAAVPAGTYWLRAEASELGRSEAVEIDLAEPVDGISLSIADPVRFDYTIVDDATGAPIPGRLAVIGEHPAVSDLRLFDAFDRVAGTAKMVYAVEGTSFPAAADPPLILPAGSEYRIVATRGTEWSSASVRVAPSPGDPPGELEFRLRHVVPTPGYLSSEFHQHSVGSPDSPVGRLIRIHSFIAEGIEFVASTDHDYITDFQPIIEAHGLARLLHAVPGSEITPFAYGHFQAYPLAYDPTDPANGAVDWARNADGYALVPGEIFDAARARGAQVLQVNHPRATGTQITAFGQYFDRVALTFDYDNRIVSGDPAAAPIPTDWFRFPAGAQLWSDGFNALEVWNGFSAADTNGDGVREMVRLDLVMRDWFNFLSFGYPVAPVGNSDSHSAFSTPVGVPRTYIAVPDDSELSIASGAAAADALDALAGEVGMARDVVVTNGPFIEIRVAGEPGSALGRTVAVDESAQLEIEVRSPAWAHFDTLEVFVNTAPDIIDRTDTVLQPALCLTSRELESLAVEDPCALAPLGVSSLAVDSVEVAPGHRRLQAEATVEIRAADVPTLNRDGASGTDAWIAVRVRGDRAIYPLHLPGVLSGDTLPAILAGDEDAVAAAMDDIGVPATAFTSPVYLDFDGNGFRAPFAP